MEASFGPPVPVLRPPPERLDDLVGPLTAAESRVFEALRGLEPGWTVYTKPRIGLDTPDFLAIHDRHGVCAIEVADWAPHTTRCTADGLLELHGADGSWQLAEVDPRFRASRHRSSIFDQFYALPEHGGSPSSSVRSVVVLPDFVTAAAGELFANCCEEDQTSLVGVWGGDALSTSIGDIVRGLGCPPPPPESIEKLRRHVVASERMGLPTGWNSRMSPGMVDIAENASALRHRRISGGAGTGKSNALAARAAKLASNGKRVLVLSFNVTLANRLRSMVDGYTRDIGANATLVACANFHSFCTRVVQDAEVAGAQLSAPPGMPWTVGIVAKATQAYELGFGDRFDAILIDEAQDYTAEWWTLLRDRVLVDGGETLVAVDPTQDIYERVTWLDGHEASAPGSVTTGDQVRLDASLRMPNDLVALTSQFAREQLAGDGDNSRDVVVATPMTAGDAGSVRNWVDVERVQELGRAIGREVVRMLDECPTLSPGDIAFVCDYHHDGVAAVRVIEAAGIPVHHIFSRDPDAPRRRRKHRFWPDAAAVKGCTAHSLKGWQAPAVVLGIGADDRARRLAYVAMTRTALPDDGSPAFVSVINADRSLAEFGVRFVAGSAAAPAAPAASAPMSVTPTPVTPMTPMTPSAPATPAAAVAPPPPPAVVPSPPAAVPAPPAAVPAPAVAVAASLPSPSVPLVAPRTLAGVAATVPMPGPPQGSGPFDVSPQGSSPSVAVPPPPPAGPPSSTPPPPPPPNGSDASTGSNGSGLSA